MFNARVGWDVNAKDKKNVDMKCFKSALRVRVCECVGWELFLTGLSHAGSRSR